MNQVVTNPSYQLSSGYHGTHIESQSNKQLEDICAKNHIFFLKNWGILSSSPSVAQNNTPPLLNEQYKALMIIRRRLAHLLSSQDGISKLLDVSAYDILQEEFDDEVLRYVCTIQRSCEKHSVVSDFYEVSESKAQPLNLGLMPKTRSWSNKESLHHRVLAILEWARKNVDGPVSVI